MIIGSMLESKIFSQVDTKYNSPLDSGTVNFPASPDTERKYERNNEAIQKHITFEGAIDFARKRLVGKATIDFEAISGICNELVLDCKGLEIHSVEFAKSKEDEPWQPCPYTYTDDEIVIAGIFSSQKGDSFSIRISYETQNPKAGIYFTSKTAENPTTYDCVWTQGQATDTPFWLPCQDDPKLKVTTDFQLTFPRSWDACANGHEVSSIENEATRTKRWVMTEKHSPYLFAIVAGEFVTMQSQLNNTDIRILLPKTYSHLGQKLLDETAEMIRFYGKIWNYEYPWKTYTQAFVANFIFGGMENTTLTINTDQVLGPDDFMKGTLSYRFLMMHELAHQWFGDLLTCETWSDGWLNEGFAMHSEVLFEEHLNGPDSGLFYFMNEIQSWYFQESSSYQRPIVTNHYENSSEIFDAHLYAKGAMVLHYLRAQVGRDAFERTVNRYLKTHAYGAVNTLDLSRAFELETGWSPRKIFDHMIFKSGHAEVDVTYKSPKKNLSTLEIQIHNKRSNGTERPAIETSLVFVLKNGEVTFIPVTLENGKTTLNLPCPDKFDFAVIDPECSIIGQVNHTWDQDTARRILKHSLTTTSRICHSSYWKFLAVKSLLKDPILPQDRKYIFEHLGSETLIQARKALYQALAQAQCQELFETLHANPECDGLAFVDWLKALVASCPVQKMPNLADEFLKKLHAKEFDSICLQAVSSTLQLLTQMTKICSELRSLDWKNRLIQTAKDFSNRRSHSSLIENAAAGLLAELGTWSDLTDEVALRVTKESEPWQRQLGALQAIARFVKLHPDVADEARPFLTTHSKAWHPARMISALPNVWLTSEDPGLMSTFSQFLTRKPYGFFSHSLPGARRLFKEFTKATQKKALGDYQADYQNLKEKVKTLEQDVKRLTLLVEQSQALNKGSVEDKEAN